MSGNILLDSLLILRMRDRKTPLALLDHRLPGRKAVVETYEYPIRMVQSPLSYQC